MNNEIRSRRNGIMPPTDRTCAVFSFEDEKQKVFNELISGGSRWTTMLFGCLIITSFSISISSSVQPLRWKFREWSPVHLHRYFERWLAISASLFRSGPPGLKNVIMICDWNKIESSFRWQIPYYFLFVQIAIKPKIRNNFFG